MKLLNTNSSGTVWIPCAGSVANMYREHLPSVHTRGKHMPRGWGNIQRWPSACDVIWQTLKIYLVFDKYVLAITTIFVLLFVPLIPRSTDNAQKLAAFIN